MEQRAIADMHGFSYFQSYCWGMEKMGTITLHFLERVTRSSGSKLPCHSEDMVLAQNAVDCAAALLIQSCLDGEGTRD
jgi:hypothetical protein